ncbi:SDR family NAD(P)-dependent oxidoreductase [Sinorhizobium psoraleae]|uniref:SDR family NAD(P)-dependent oxidoreductase n=1 Tax=Sinorhizobium psoraleae TaxID=520838 RepID=A0ABT4KMU4_9HYPH|nr:SDR family NAD(P)-dependent oxidoreductase [Sinorhizobium psoraleae]MCZ4093287.1 SDR family NAD(P)-dependent oxidoreductase [Sinorhizobium psoraleae]
MAAPYARLFAAEARAAQRALRNAVHASRESSALSQFAATLSGAGVEARPFAADITDVAACDALIGKIAAWAGRLDALISNAGKSLPGKLAEMSPGDRQQMLDLNLRATWLLARAAYRSLIASCGSITAIASISLPDLRLWKPPGEPDWTCALVPETLPFKPADTYS